MKTTPIRVSSSQDARVHYAVTKQQPHTHQPPLHTEQKKDQAGDNQRNNHTTLNTNTWCLCCGGLLLQDPTMRQDPHTIRCVVSLIFHP